MFKRICSVLSGMILVVLAIAAGLLLIPRAAGYQTMAVLTGSMEPNYPVGSLIYVKETAPEELKPGDVITFHISADTVVTHRIVEINEAEQEVVTKGDANNTKDGNPVSYNNIVGKAEFHIPYLGYVAIYSRTPLGIGAVCGLLILVILLNFLPEILTKEEENEKEMNLV